MDVRAVSVCLFVLPSCVACALSLRVHVLCVCVCFFACTASMLLYQHALPHDDHAHNLWCEAQLATLEPDALFFLHAIKQTTSSGVSP